MQVSDVKPVDTFDDGQNTYKTMTVLNSLLNIFALSCNGHHFNNLKSSVCIVRKVITALVFGMLTVYTFYYKILYVNNILNISVWIIDNVQMTFDYCQYLIDLFYVYKYGRHVCYEYFKQYCTIDHIIGTGAYCSIIKGRLNKLIGLFVTIWLTTSVCDMAAWVIGYGWSIPLAFSLAYIFLLIKILTNLDLTSHVMHVQFRLLIISSWVQNYYTSANSHPAMVCDAVQNRNWFYTDVTYKEEPEVQSKVFKTTQNITDHIKWISRSYLLLTEQCTFINQMFGIRILLNILSFFIDMVRFSNIAVRLIIGSQNTLYASNVFPIVSTIFRLLTCVVILVSLVDHCEKTYRQQERIISIIDHLLINKNPGPELQQAISELRNLIQSRPINFHLANFFRVDYSLLVSTASVVATYTIILLQSIK